MQIAEKKVVTLNYTLKDNEGTLIDESSDGSFIYLQGASNIIPGLEKALIGKTSGEKMNVTVAPDEAYGPRDDSRIEEVPRDMFPDDVDIEPGMEFHAEGPDGQAISIVVVEVKEDKVNIDGNHPLAGVELNFDVEVMDVRDATDEEIEHGHVHGAHGHEH
jgi:FKBP-type peptidyl-prolyl cis-trans isomerase SlyD